MAGYERLRTAEIQSGLVVKSASINTELSSIETAFAFSGGHDHSGSSASTSGAYVPLIADVDGLNKAAVDTSNNRIGFFVEVSSAAAEQIRIQDGAIMPVPTGTDGISLGSTGTRFKDGFFAGDVTITGTLTAGSLSGALSGATITATTAFVPDASDGAALGTSSLEFSDLFLADGAVINLGADQDVTLTHYADNGVLLNSTRKLYFEDGSNYDQYIGSAGSGVTAIAAPTEIDLTATTIDINGAADISGNLDVGGTLGVTGAVTANAGVVIDNITIDGTEIDLSSGDLTLDVAGDIILNTDDGVVSLQDDSATFGSLENTSGNLIIKSGTTTAITFSGANASLAGTLTVAGASTLAATSFGDANITDVGDIALDSISADDTDINVAVSDNSATAFTIKQGSDAYLIIDTANSSESVSIGTGILGTAITLGHSTSEVTVADNLTVTGDLTVNGTTTTVNSTTVTVDDPVITLGGDTAPGSDDNKDRGIEFRYHDGSSARVGFFGWDDSATAFTFLTAATNSSEVFSGTAGNLAGLGTIGSGAITSTGAVQGTSFVVADGGNIGSVSDTDAVTIASGGGVTFSQGVTSTAASNTLGATSFNDADITNVGDIALDSISADDTDINVAVTDNSATAFTIKQGSDAYLVIDTGNGDESVSIGTGVSGTAVSIGHSVSTVTVNDNLTVTDTATFGSLSDGSVTIANFVNEAAGINSNDNDTTIPTSAAVKDLVSTSANVTGLNATGTELNAVADVSAVNLAGIDTSTAIANADGILVFDKSANSNEGAIGYFDVDLLDTYYASTTQTLSNKTLTSPKFTNGGFIADANGNELIKLHTTGSAVNELAITNAASGGAVTIGTSGETNVDIDIAPAGSGEVNIGSNTVIATDKKILFRDSGLYLNSSADGQLDIVADTEVQIAATTVDINGAVEISGTTAQVGVSTSTAKDIFNAGMSVKNGSTSAGFVEFFENSGNGTNKATLIGPASTADITLTLPSTAGTIATTTSAADEATALAIALG